MTSASSCTAAIAATLIAVGAKGSVIIPAFTFPATASAVKMAGANPLVVDVDPSTWCLSPELLEHALGSERCGAVIVVCPFGLKQDFTPYFEICRRHGVPLLIDNASGLSDQHFPLVDERCFEIYSLHATKPFAIGEGGAIRSVADQSRALRRSLNFGLEGGVAVPRCWGINGKLPEVSGAIGLAVLESYSRVLAHRRAIAERYIAFLPNSETALNLANPERCPWQVFPLLMPSAEASAEFTEAAANEGLQIRRAYHPSLQHWPETRTFRTCPSAAMLADRMVSLPVYSDMTDEEIQEVLTILSHTLDDRLRREVSPAIS